MSVAERSGQVLRELVPSIRKTADLVQEVAAASAEQSSGVAQVNKAMARVDQVTQRNASAAEELASTAEEMAAQAQGLEQLVAFFRVGAEAAPQRPAVPAPQQPRAAWVAPTVVERPRRSHSRGQRLRRDRRRLRTVLEEPEHDSVEGSRGPGAVPHVLGRG